MTTPLFDGLSFDLKRGDRVAVLSSTLLIGETEADAAAVRRRRASGRRSQARF